MDFGNYIKYSDVEYDVFVDKEKKYSGYNVVSKELDKYAKYDLDDVTSYAKSHPEMELPQWAEEQPTLEEREARVREDRDFRITSIRWRVERYNDEKLLGVQPTEAIEPVLSYIQQLRDVPQQAGFPDNVVWPEIP